MNIMKLKMLDFQVAPRTTHSIPSTSTTRLDDIAEIYEKPKDYIVKFNFHGLGQDSSIGGLQVVDAAFSYDPSADGSKEKPYLLDSLDFGVDCSSRVAIVGPNGVGKSTFLNVMMKKLDPLEGEVRHANALRVGHYHQHFEELLPLEKNGVEFLMSAFEKQGITNQQQARAALGQFGLPSEAHLTKIGKVWCCLWSSILNDCQHFCPV